MLAATRIGIAVVALGASLFIAPNQPVNVPGWPAPDGRGLVEGVALERWDALWFLRIASDGYRPDDGSAAFFPAYPLTVRALSWAIGGHPLAAAVLVSHLFFYGALVLFHLLGRLEYDDATARRSVLYLALFPTAFFGFAPYSESMFLFLSLAAVLSARLGRWVPASASAACAAATRSVGVLLAVPLALEALAKARAGRRRVAATLGKMAAPAAAAGVGLLAYLAYWSGASGNALAPFRSQEQWLRQAWPPWETLRQATSFAWSFDSWWHRLDWIVVVPMLGVALWSLPKMRRSYAAYVLLSLTAMLSFVFPARPLMSMPRFLLGLFPLFWGLAFLARRRITQVGVAVGLGATQALFVALFVRWYWIF